MKNYLLILSAFVITTIGYAQTFTVGDFTYDILTGNNRVRVSDYDASAGTSVNIPVTVTNPNTSIVYNVTNIGPEAFKNKGLVNVTMNDGLQYISKRAFDINSLQSITLPNSVYFIGESAFRNNSITNVNLSSGLVQISKQAFGWNNIESITLPSLVQNIGSQAFRDNPLTQVISEAIIPPFITTIAGLDDSFNSDRSGIDLTVPIGSTAAYTTDANAKWTGFKSVAEDSTFIDSYITYQVTSTVNRTLKTIDYNTAGGNIVNIPAWLTYNGLAYQVTSIGSNSFYNNSLTEIDIPQSIISIGEAAFKANDIKDVAIPNGVVSLGKEAFSQNQLENLVLSDNLTEIEENAFEKNKLTSVTIPNSITNIGYAAFRMNQLTSVTFSNSSTDIGVAAFASNKLTSFVFPESIISIAGSVLLGNQLTSITIPDNVTTIGSNAFANNQLANIEIPNNVVSIGISAFARNQLTSITLGNNLESIEGSAFRSNLLTSITIPSSVTLIDNQVFKDNPINNVVAEGTTPPFIITGGNGETFNIDRSNIDLRIPSGTKAAYVTNAGALWTGFKSVSEEEVTGVLNEVLAREIIVIAAANSINLNISDKVNYQNFTLYNTSGKLVATANTKEISTTVLSSGIYILKLDFDEGSFIKKIFVY